MPLTIQLWRGEHSFPWLPQLNFEAGNYSAFIPYWVLLFPSAIATLWLWRSDRYVKIGCTQCGYDLTGNVSGICPECGEPTSFDA